MNEHFEEAKQILASKDLLGYNFEMSNIEVLKKYKLYTYVKFRNPKKPRLWKRKKGVGVDMVIKIGYMTYYLEDSFCSKEYYYRKNWFLKCRLPRFHNYPSNETHVKIIWTNKPQNFESVKDLAETFHIQIMSTNQILNLIRNAKKTPRFVVAKLLRYFGLSVTDSNVASVISDIDTDSELTNKTNKVYAYSNETKQQEQKQPIKDQNEHIDQTKHYDKG